MIAANRLLFGGVLFLMASGVFGNEAPCNNAPSDDLYPPVPLNDDALISFVMADSAIDPQGDVSPVVVMVKSCRTGESARIGELPYLGDPGRIESAFLADADFDGEAEIFVIHSTVLYADTGIAYGSDYYTVMVYKRLAPLAYEVSDRVRSFFGEGGDILISPESGEFAYEYPYKDESSIREILRSPNYRNWYEKRSITSKAVRKTYLHSQPSIADRTARYLIAGDEVVVLNRAAGWLEVVFHNKQKGAIRGWLICKDTVHCNQDLN